MSTMPYMKPRSKEIRDNYEGRLKRNTILTFKRFRDEKIIETMENEGLIIPNPTLKKAFASDHPLVESLPWLEDVYTVDESPQLEMNYTILRNEATVRRNFIIASNRVSRLIIESGLNLLPTREEQIMTPTGVPYLGTFADSKILGVPIWRAGDAMKGPLETVCEAIRISQTLIQRNDIDASAIDLNYNKHDRIPNIELRYAIIIDPMIATGGSVVKAIAQLIAKGVDPRKILFFNIISCPQGLERIGLEYPSVRIVTGVTDPGLNEKKYIIPGLGDYGDRFHGTTVVFL